jgi:hypothetical protein
MDWINLDRKGDHKGRIVANENCVLKIQIARRIGEEFVVEETAHWIKGSPTWLLLAIIADIVDVAQQSFASDEEVHYE